MPTLSYALGSSLYLNITSACTAKCFFCPRSEDPTVQKYDLALGKDPSVDEILASIENPYDYKEIVYCGFGEPTLRLSEILLISKKLLPFGVPFRLNTNGHGNLIHGQSILPRLSGLIDKISVSLNAANETDYIKTMQPAFKEGVFDSVIRFILEARDCIPEVTVTAVNHPGFNRKEFEDFVNKKLGVLYRIRKFDALGDQSSNG